MKTIYFILFLMTFAPILSAQQSIDHIMQLRPTEVDYYKSASTYKITMPFGESRVIAKELPEVADLEHLVSIDLVYTGFRRSERFSQPKLNRYRLGELKKLMPEIFELENVTWNIIEQTGAINKTDAEKLFHGFVINIKEVRGSEDIELIETIVSQKNSSPLPDSTVLKVFDRHKWDKMLITADLTGSMSPHIAQVLLWLKLNDINKRAKYFMFFNDGNTTPDEQKKVGKTGGLYDAPATTYSEIEALAFKTIRNGDGGDWPENDVEALYFGIQRCPTCKDVILIADNDAPMRDWRMMKLIKKPVRIILCGGEEGYINPQYLNLARTTKGSIHTMEQDITTLMELNEGETIEIDGLLYKIYKGNFVVAKKS